MTTAAGRVAHCGQFKNTQPSQTKTTPATKLKLHRKIDKIQQKNYNTEYLVILSYHVERMHNQISLEVMGDRLVGLGGEGSPLIYVDRSQLKYINNEQMCNNMCVM